MIAPWRVAAIAGDSATMSRLIADGLDIDGRDRYGQTALMLAAHHGHAELVHLLIAKGAQLDITAKYGLSALLLAVIGGHAEVAKILIDAGADLSMRGTGAPGFADKTARDLARERGLHDLAAYLEGAEGGR